MQCKLLKSDLMDDKNMSILHAFIMAADDLVMTGPRTWRTKYIVTLMFIKWRHSSQVKLYKRFAPEQYINLLNFAQGIIGHDIGLSLSIILLLQNQGS